MSDYLINKISNELFLKKYMKTITSSNCNILTIKSAQNTSNELFFIEVLKALNEGWASNENEKNYWVHLLISAKKNDKNALILLRAEFKYNEAFKKETAKFKNV